MKVRRKKRFLSVKYCFYLYLGKDAYDVAVEKEFDECRDIVARALEKRGIKPGVKPNQSGSDKLAEDVDKLKIKR